MFIGFGIVFCFFFFQVFSKFLLDLGFLSFFCSRDFCQSALGVAGVPWAVRYLFPPGVFRRGRAKNQHDTTP